jgi:PAS domain S-box-containing protein
MTHNIRLSGKEQFFDDDDIIVSKTDLKGRLTYCNKVFLDIAGYTEQECLGQQHSMIRHPDMPRSIFKLLWDTIKDGHEIFAYVVNRCKNGDHYWVYAHVTPSFDPSGDIVGYHSNRRVPDKAIVKETIIPFYQALKAEEDRGGNRKEAMHRAEQIITDTLEKQGLEYDEWVLTLGHAIRKTAA